jgi:hypothetical protein
MADKGEAKVTSLTPAKKPKAARFGFQAWSLELGEEKDAPGVT